MKLTQVIQTLEEIAPTRYAEPWDNVGLLVGDLSKDVSSIMLTIDYTAEVAEEARSANCDLLIAYHPPIWDGLKKIDSTSLIYDAIRRSVAIYSPHTALDIAPGGTNDMLADAIGLIRPSPLKRASPAVTQYKLVTFVPEDHVEKVASALFNAGAGKIGDYSSCSFRIKGTGTFFGGEGANPSAGSKGKLEQVQEIRIETVLPVSAIDSVIQALKQSHPYEEPAFDLNMLAAHPTGLGMGRIGEMPFTPMANILDSIKRALEIKHLLVAGPATGNITKAAVCAGACGKLLDDAIAQKAQLYLTGEMRHHDALRAASLGMTVVCVLHSNSERAVLKRLSAELSKRLAAAEPAAPLPAIHLSRKDRDPFSVL
ncbi:MAG TPA: Nif3-like dinuclear metal center hexameric protein [Tepidisphaeraceae bacterium]|nr:Nif3-like dinuclear metal center hexameric protein [Tepidisphaeraceae bacterium]